MKSRYILLVEDNPDDVDLTLRSFKRNNILNDVVVMKDGAEALDYLFRKGNYSARVMGLNPDVVILDIKLPKVSGLDVLKRMRENEDTRYIPVVILTSSKEEADVVEGYKSGANSYVRKPLNFETFSEAVRQLGLYWLVMNEPLPRME